jgi:uncharacterized membrane protein
MNPKFSVIALNITGYICLILSYVIHKENLITISTILFVGAMIIASLMRDK